MEQILAADSEDGLEYGEQTVEGEEDCVWVSEPETSETEDENRVGEEEEYVGLPSSGRTDREEEEMDEQEIMDEEHQILCEGSQGTFARCHGLRRTLLCVCAVLMPNNDAMTCLNTGFNVALGVGVSSLTVFVLG